MAIKRIAILTGGGDCPGINAVIRAVTKTAILRYGLEVWGIEDAFLGLIENRLRPLPLESVSDILTLGGTILGTTNRCDPRQYRASNGEPPRDMLATCLENLRSHEIDAVVCIGGDGTMLGVANFVAHGMNCIGVPKTIDNDIMGTDVTFGFATARYVATMALDRIHTTAASHRRAMIVEVMGRNAGWLALHSGIASGADVILLPEIPFDLAKVCDHIAARNKRGRRFTILCVSEGAKPRDGQQVVQEYNPNSPDPVRLGGVGQVVAQQIEERTGTETRCTVLGHVQRGGTPLPGDRVLATELGCAAVTALMAGKRNRLIAVRGRELTDIDIAQATRGQRTVPLDHPLIDTARAIGTCFGD